jgi:hypothetical protein
VPQSYCLNTPGLVTMVILKINQCLSLNFWYGNPQLWFIVR